MTKSSTKNIEIRKRNIEALLNVLFKERLSASELSRELKLSKTAVINILTEMEEQRLVVNVAEQNGTSDKWQRTSYEISENVGAIQIVEFGSIYIKIVYAFLNGKIIDEVMLEDEEFLTRESLDKVLVNINKLMAKNNLKDKILLTIISTPGQIHKDTGDIVKSIKFRAIKDINVKEWFEKNTKTEVLLKNDINISILGELDKTGDIEHIHNAALIFVDSGMGGAIINDGKLLEGIDGFAAEFGLIKTYDRFGNYVYYDIICSLNSIKKQIVYRKQLVDEPLEGNGRFRYRHVVKLYNEDDYITMDVIRYSAKKLGYLINDLSNILNYKHFIIGGRIKALGERYLNWVRDEVLDKDIKVVYSTYLDESMIHGAINIAAKHVFKMLADLR